MGSKKKTTTTQTGNSTQTNTPAPYALPGMQQIGNYISGVLPSLQNINYTGDFVAAPSDLSLGVPNLYQQAANTALGLVPQAQGALNGAMQAPTFEGPGLEGSYNSFAGSNPGGMEAAIQAAINPVSRNLMETILPSLQSSAIDSGAYGNSRAMTTLPAIAIGTANRDMQELAAQMTYQDFVDQQERQQSAYGLGTERGLGEAGVMTDRYGMTPDLLDSIMRLSGGAAELQAAGGQADEANRQAVIDNAMKQFEYQMNRPFMGYDVATDLLTKLTAGFGTQAGEFSNKSKTVESTGGMGNVLAGALGLASMIGGFPMGGGGSVGGSLVSSLFGRKPSGG